MLSGKDYCSASRRYGSMIREAEQARRLGTLPAAQNRWRRIAFWGWCIGRRTALALVRLIATQRHGGEEIPINSRPWQKDGD